MEGDRQGTPDKEMHIIISDGKFYEENKDDHVSGRWIRGVSSSAWYLSPLDLLSQNRQADKKEKNWVICSDVDEPRLCHTEWSKWKREKQLSSNNSCV